VNLTFEGIRITGVAAAVPAQIVDNLTPQDNFTSAEAEKFVHFTGIRRRRRAPAGVCATDLCHAAAAELLRVMDLDVGSIDIIISVSQSPDYLRGSNSLILQHRLGLSRAVAVDVPVGCSGFVYGLFTAYSMLNHPGVRRVLLVNGELLTRYASQRDKATGLLFGDSGTATIIERDHGSGRSWLSLHSDGSRRGVIMTPAGGLRNPSTEATRRERVFEDGSIRSDEHMVMDGAGVFAFILSDVYADLRQICEWSGVRPDQLDYLILHQANRFALEHVRRKLGIPPERVPYSLDEFGNTSGPSIPLTMVTRLSEVLRHGRHRVLCSGFGVGLSWGSIIQDLGPMTVCDLVEV
jgi:3-oxoacyl-[acyl-carrier-protein] synthase III